MGIPDPGLEIREEISPSPPLPSPPQRVCLRSSQGVLLVTLANSLAGPLTWYLA